MAEATNLQCFLIVLIGFASLMTGTILLVFAISCCRHCSGNCSCYSDCDDGAIGTGTIFTVFGSILVLFSCPMTTRRLVIAGRQQANPTEQTNLTETTEKVETSNQDNVKTEKVEVNIELTDLREKLQFQNTQGAHEIVELNSLEEAKVLGRE